MSALAHHGTIALPLPLPRKRRHLSVVPAPAPEVARVLGSPVVPERDRHPAAVRPAAEQPLRLTARGRRVLAVLMLTVAAAAGAVAGTVVSAATPLPTEVETVTVSSGDSLWSIAAAVTEPGADVREVMSQIVALNDLQSQSLTPGQALTVPSGD